MKKLSLVIALFIAIGAFAQKRGQEGRGPKGNDFTPEQKTQLMVMKLSVALDLSEKQEAAITPLVAEKIEKMAEKRGYKKGERAERKELSSDEKFEMAMKRLEEQKILQTKMKDILDKDQYAQWRKMHKKQMEKMSQGRKKDQGRKRRPNRGGDDF